MADHTETVAQIHSIVEGNDIYVSLHDLTYFIDQLIEDAADDVAEGAIDEDVPVEHVVIACAVLNCVKHALVTSITRGTNG